MSQKLPKDTFKWIKSVSMLDEKFIKNYCKDSDIGYILEVDIEYPKHLHDLHSNLPSLPDRMKINKCHKFACNLYDKKNYVVHIKTLKQALNHGLVFKKVHKAITFYQEAWLKPYIDMNTELKEEAKNNFEKDFLS